ncbi:MAG: CoA activase [Deltaproteobacteria bacterium]|nr:CoA activase [Deltaproteobacteria bacterium]
MITAGIDIGAMNVKVVVLEDGDVVARTQERTGFDPAAAAEKAVAAALSDAQVKSGELSAKVATGAGRKDVAADGEITEVTAAAKGIHHLHPDVRTVIDVGAEEGRGVKVGDSGSVVDFVVNEKCAAGSGAFTEAMARAIEVTLEEFGQISLGSEKTLPMNAQCAVFAESEVVSLVHSGTPKQDIARAVHDSISSRIVSMVRRIGIEEKVALVGGVAYNAGFHDSLERGMQRDVIVPDNPEFVGALGAALAAAEKG